MVDAFCLIMWNMALRRPAVCGALDRRPRRSFPGFCAGQCRYCQTDQPEREIEAAAAGAFVVIMTHSHLLDYSIAAAALLRPELGFVGLIGSNTKRARFESQALKMGLGAPQIARLTCPIGLTEIKGKEPSIIAASVAAQLLIERERAVSRQIGAADVR